MDSRRVSASPTGAADDRDVNVLGVDEEVLAGMERDLGFSSCGGARPLLLREHPSSMGLAERLGEW